MKLVRKLDAICNNLGLDMEQLVVITEKTTTQLNYPNCIDLSDLIDELRAYGRYYAMEALRKTFLSIDDTDDEETKSDVEDDELPDLEWNMASDSDSDTDIDEPELPNELDSYHSEDNASEEEEDFMYLVDICEMENIPLAKLSVMLLSDVPEEKAKNFRYVHLSTIAQAIDVQAINTVVNSLHYLFREERIARKTIRKKYPKQVPITASKRKRRSVLSDEEEPLFKMKMDATGKLSFSPVKDAN